MFLINVIDLMVKLDIIRYIFVGFGFYGVMLLIQRLVLNK